MIRTLFHGSDGDSILQLLKTRQMQPDPEGRIFFSEHRYESVLMHGADLKRKLTFAIKMHVYVPNEAALQKKATPGVDDTVVLISRAPVRVDVLELYVRRPRATAIETFHGAAAIERFLIQAA
jgi:hypothetical protein